MARAAFEALPAEFRALVGEVPCVGRRFPGRRDHQGDGARDRVRYSRAVPRRRPAAGRRDAGYTGQLPNQIWLYRRPILDYWAERRGETLGEIVTHVLVHEIGHHFGFSDDDMEAIEAAARTRGRAGDAATSRLRRGDELEIVVELSRRFASPTLRARASGLSSSPNQSSQRDKVKPAGDGRCPALSPALSGILTEHDAQHDRAARARGQFYQAGWRPGLGPLPDFVGGRRMRDIGAPLRLQYKRPGTGAGPDALG